MKKNVTLVYDGQYGSTGKGLLVGYLSEREVQPDVAVTAWGPNAGHTYVDSRGQRMVHTMLATSIVSPNLKTVLISAGSYVNLPNLKAEIIAALKLGYGDYEVRIHQNAAVCDEEHAQVEKGRVNAIGSTQKGMGAAMIAKIRRDPKLPATMGQMVEHEYGFVWEARHRGRAVRVSLVSNDEYQSIIQRAESVLVEGAQGFSLGINSGFYPYTTSRECTVAQILADCQINYRRVARTICVIRTLPIRVANRYAEMCCGAEYSVGWSGPHYLDQSELSWEEVGQDVETTTVTKLPRRVFTFSQKQLHDCLSINPTDEIFLNFVNYLEDAADELGKFSRRIAPPEWPTVINFIEGVRRIGRQHGAELRYIGTGPTVEDVSLVSGDTPNPNQEFAA